MDGQRLNEACGEARTLRFVHSALRSGRCGCALLASAWLAVGLSGKMCLIVILDEG